jgi:molybdate transport system regulatory protein
VRVSAVQYDSIRGERPMATRVTLRLDFDNACRLGPGKVALLEAIGRTGSIAAAGREFGMAYRRAWLLIDELNHMFSTPLVATRGGGRNGGGATLTAAGTSIVAMYRDAERKVRRTAAREIEAIERALATSRPAG